MLAASSEDVLTAAKRASGFGPVHCSAQRCREICLAPAASSGAHESTCSRPRAAARTPVVLGRNRLTGWIARLRTRVAQELPPEPLPHSTISVSAHGRATGGPLVAVQSASCLARTGHERQSDQPRVKVDLSVGQGTDQYLWSSCCHCSH